MLVCDKCRAKIADGYKFCPECGDPVTEADMVKENAITMHGKIPVVTLVFGYSTSGNYQRAVEICSKNPSYESTGDGRAIQHKVTLPITEAELLGNLYDLVGSWKSSFMQIDGVSATKKDLVYGGVGCFRDRQKAYDSEMYCYGSAAYERNIWGCKRLNMPLYEWGGGWLELGAFDSKGLWHFDKKAIRHELESAIEENKLCPVINREMILKTLDLLPDTINPKVDKNWRYRTTTERTEKGGWADVAVGISPVIKRANSFVIAEHKPFWQTEDDGEESIDKDIIFSHSQPSSEEPHQAEESVSSSTWQDKVNQYGVYTGSQEFLQEHKGGTTTKKKGLSAKWIIIGISVVFFLIIRSCSG